MNTVEKGFLLTRHSYDHHGSTHICLWVSTSHGPAQLLTNHEPSIFFILSHDKVSAEKILTQQSIYFEYKLLKLETFNHETLTGLYFRTLTDYFKAQQQLNKHNILTYESDIRPTDRFLMERFVYGSLEYTGHQSDKPQHNYSIINHAKIRACHYTPQLTHLSLDIECSMTGELYCIGLYSQSPHFQQVIMIGDKLNKPEWMQCVSNEKDLLIELIKAINRFDPDIIIGWNVVNFDFRILLKRAEIYHLPLTLGRDGSSCRWRENQHQGFISIAGRVVIDGIDALKTASYHFPSFTLESVAQALLGKGKLSENHLNRIEEITYNFNNDKLKLAEYNLQDCQLVWDIFNQTQLIPFLVFRSQITGLELDRQGGSVAAFYNLYLPHLHRAGYIAPNLPTQHGPASPGGYVMTSTPGLYHNVIVLDYKSLYPSIIRTFKIDPLGLIKGMETPENAIPGYRGAYFSRDEHFLPAIITQLWAQRDEAKKQNDHARSQAIKIIMNSFYGVLGSSGCRFYDTRLASSITLRGHDIIQKTSQWINELGYQVIYGDTDSIFIVLPEHANLEKCQAIALDLQNEINDNWKHLLHEELSLECHLEIEFDCHYTRFLMPTIRGSDIGSKKRYAGLIQWKTPNGIEEKIIFKGLESVRTDWTELAKAFQRELFHCVFHDQDPTPYISNTLHQLRTGQVDHLLIYRKRLRQPINSYIKNIPPHARAAKLADEYNKSLGKPLEYQQRGWISYIMTTIGPEPMDYHQNPINYEHYIEKQLKPIAEAILPLAGINIKINQQTQFDLFSQ